VCASKNLWGPCPVEGDSTRLLNHGDASLLWPQVDGLKAAHQQLRQVNDAVVAELDEVRRSSEAEMRRVLQELEMGHEQNAVLEARVAELESQQSGMATADTSRATVEIELLRDELKQKDQAVSSYKAQYEAMQSRLSEAQAFGKELEDGMSAMRLLYTGREQEIETLTRQLEVLRATATREEDGRRQSQEGTNHGTTMGLTEASIGPQTSAPRIDLQPEPENPRSPITDGCQKTCGQGTEGHEATVCCGEQGVVRLKEEKDSLEKALEMVVADRSHLNETLDLLKAQKEQLESECQVKHMSSRCVTLWTPLLICVTARPRRLV
jgi:uncharacterized protein YfcZ (UPF0381/DUF406 family)